MLLLSVIKCTCLFLIDHRIVDGALGGAFLRRIADYLEDWDLNKAFKHKSNKLILV